MDTYIMRQTEKAQAGRVEDTCCLPPAYAIFVAEYAIQVSQERKEESKNVASSFHVLCKAINNPLLR